MKHFVDVKCKSELKKKYRTLALTFHPDKGGRIEKMQELNNEFALLSKTWGVMPKSLPEVQEGNLVYVNSSKCIVTMVEHNHFKAKSTETSREAFFDKSTGYGLLNFKIRAYVN